MENCQDIVDRHIKFLNNYRIDVPSEYRCLPLFYWLSKLHKNHMVLYRFIAASHKCTTKPLSTSCLKLITVHYCNGMFCRTGVNCFWIIDNSQQVLSTLNKINYFSTARHFDSYDFSTLYTSIPHTAIKQALETLVREAESERQCVHYSR